MVELVAPDVGLQGAWLEAHDEWGAGAHEDGFGLVAGDDVRSVAGFAAFVGRLRDAAGGVTHRWIVEDGRVLGGIALRHADDDRARTVGHIGFGIRPTARRRGLAAWALGQVLDEAAQRGLDEVLLVCAADNVASARTIERLGGVLLGIEATEHGPARRYRLVTTTP